MNRVKERNRIWVVLSLPPDTGYQRVQEPPIFTREPLVITKDRKFGNQYAVWENELQDTPYVVEERFTISVVPRKVSIQEKYFLPDYIGRMAVGEYALYLESNKYIQADDPGIKKLADGIAKNTKDVYEIISRFNEYVISNLQYGNPITGLYLAKDALEKKVVDCGGFDTLLAALCIARGIPARVVSGFWAGYKKNEMHAWVEILLPNGEWFPADPSVEHLRKKGRTAKNARLGFVGSDRIALGVGSDIPIEINSQVERVDILQHPFILAENGNDSIEVKTEFIVEAESRR